MLYLISPCTLSFSCNTRIIMRLSPNIVSPISFEIVFDTLPRYKTSEHCSRRRITFISLCQFCKGMKLYYFRLFCSEKKLAKTMNISAHIRVWSNGRDPSFDSFYFESKFMIGQNEYALISCNMNELIMYSSSMYYYSSVIFL